MVWSYGNSSDSEEERTDRFRSERTSGIVNNSDPAFRVSPLAERRRGRDYSGGGASLRVSPQAERRRGRGMVDRGRPEPPTRICFECDYKADQCRCSNRAAEGGRRERVERNRERREPRRTRDEERRTDGTISEHNKESRRNVCEDSLSDEDRRSGERKKKKKEKKCKKKSKKEGSREQRREEKKRRGDKSQDKHQSSKVDETGIRRDDEVTGGPEKDEVVCLDSSQGEISSCSEAEHSDPVKLPGREEREPEAADSYGPSLPPEQNGARVEVDTSPLPEDTYGPRPPPNKVYGPMLPNCPGDASCPRSDTAEEKYGPSLPPPSEEEEEVMFGPLPPGSSHPTQLLLEHRANLLRSRINTKEEEKEEPRGREEWMLELPENRSSALGLPGTARTFRTRPSDAVLDPTWTHTPADKARALAKGEKEEKKESEEERGKREALARRDADMERQVEEANRQRNRSDRSLLELHQDRIKRHKKKADKEGKKAERRPFSRDTDLATTRLSSSQREAIFKKAKILDSKFSSGQAKYL